MDTGQNERKNVMVMRKCKKNFTAHPISCTRICRSASPSSDPALTFEAADQPPLHFQRQVKADTGCPLVTPFGRTKTQGTYGFDPKPVLETEKRRPKEKVSGSRRTKAELGSKLESTLSSLSWGCLKSPLPPYLPPSLSLFSKATHAFLIYRNTVTSP